MCNLWFQFPSNQTWKFSLSLEQNLFLLTDHSLFEGVTEPNAKQRHHKATQATEQNKHNAVQTWVKLYKTKVDMVWFILSFFNKHVHTHVKINLWLLFSRLQSWTLSITLLGRHGDLNKEPSASLFFGVSLRVKVLL